MLPDSMPAQFQSTYTPIAAAGTDSQIKHISRLLATQLTMAGMGKGVGELKLQVTVFPLYRFLCVCGGVLSSLCWMQWQSSTVPHGNESSCWSAWLPHSYGKTPFQISVTFEPQSWSSSSKFVSPPKQQEETNNPTSTQSTRQIYRWDLKTLLSSSGANIQMGFRNITVFHLAFI